MCLIESYAWPGNVRELRNIVERLAILCDQDRIEPRHLPDEIRQGRPRTTITQLATQLGRIQTAQAAGSRFDRRAVGTPLPGRGSARCGGNVSRAAEEIGIQRTNLHALMRKHGLTSDVYAPSPLSLWERGRGGGQSESRGAGIPAHLAEKPSP